MLSQIIIHHKTTDSSRLVVIKTGTTGFLWKRENGEK
jgi:hypothetical protein